MITDTLFLLLGFTVLLGIAVLFSNNRTSIKWQQVFLGVGMQIVFAVFVILTPWGKSVFELIAQFFVKIISFTTEGSKFVFGVLADQQQFGQANPDQPGFGFLFAFQVLPTIIFFASLMSILWDYNLFSFSNIFLLDTL